MLVTRNHQNFIEYSQWVYVHKNSIPRQISNVSILKYIIYSMPGMCIGARASTKRFCPQDAAICAAVDQLFAGGGERARRPRCDLRGDARRKGEARRQRASVIFLGAFAYRVTPLRGNKSKTPAPDREITTASATVGINSTHTKNQLTPSRPKKLRRWILIDLPMGPKWEK